MNNTTHVNEGPVAAVSVLLFVQGAIVVLLAVEAVVAAVMFGGLSALSAALTVAAAVVTLRLVANLPKRRRRTRRWIMRFQVGWIVFGLLDLALALGLAGRGLTPSGFLVRIALPTSIFWLLRRPSVRSEFEDRESTDETEPSWELEEAWA